MKERTDLKERTIDQKEGTWIRDPMENFVWGMSKYDPEEPLRMIDGLPNSNDDPSVQFIALADKMPEKGIFTSLFILTIPLPADRSIADLMELLDDEYTRQVPEGRRYSRIVDIQVNNPGLGFVILEQA